MPPHLEEPTITALKLYINNATTSSITTSTPEVTSAILHIIDSQNTTLFSHGSGSPSSHPTATSISIIQSLTKIIGAITFMQLVDRGDASLDDASLITNFLPELASQQILTGYTTNADGSKTWHFEPLKADITPRMLLNHTYGGGHTFFNELLYEYFKDQGLWETTNEATDPYGTVLASPLLWHPNTRVNYGQGLDWLAVLVERIVHQDLASYMRDNIFTPLGLKSTGFEPAFGGDVLLRPGNEGRFWPRVLRTGDVVTTLDAETPVQVQRHDAFPKGAYHTGCLGTGLMSTATEYTRLVSILLPQNAGLDSVTGYRLLSPSSVAEITTPQLPAHLQNTSRNVPVSGATSIVLPAILDAPDRDPAGSFGLGCGVQGATKVLRDGRRGRGKGSVYWYGAANSACWVDGEAGIVVFVNGNYYPWNEGAWLEFVDGVEGLIYEGLRS